jgi:hypothetical protein
MEAAAVVVEARTEAAATAKDFCFSSLGLIPATLLVWARLFFRHGTGFLDGPLLFRGWQFHSA